MAFTPIDEQTWERREYLEVFRQTAIYLTAEVDHTAVSAHEGPGRKAVPGSGVVCGRRAEPARPFPVWPG